MFIWRDYSFMLTFNLLQPSFIQAMYKKIDGVQ